MHPQNLGNLIGVIQTNKSITFSYHNTWDFDEAFCAPFLPLLAPPCCTAKSARIQSNPHNTKAPSASMGRWLIQSADVLYTASGIWQSGICSRRCQTITFPYLHHYIAQNSQIEKKMNKEVLLTSISLDKGDSLNVFTQGKCADDTWESDLPK